MAITSHTWSGPAEDGLQFFDPTGNTGGAGIEQSFPTVSNQTYILSFYHGTYSTHGTANALGVTLRSSSFSNLVQNGSFEMPSNNGASYLLYGVGSTNVTGVTVIGPSGDNITSLPSTTNTLGRRLMELQWLDPTGSTGGRRSDANSQYRFQPGLRAVFLSTPATPSTASAMFWE